MKKVLVMALALGLAAAAQAQQAPVAAPAAAQAEAAQTVEPHIGKHGRDQGTPAERAKHQADKLTEKLQLSGATRGKVETILRTRMEKIDALRTQQATKVGPQVQAIKNETDAAMKSVLSPEQYVQYVSMKKQHKSLKGAKMGKGQKYEKFPANDNMQ